MLQLIKIKHGSHLYGTNTPESDTDYKSVHIPARREILLQRGDTTLDFGIKSKNEGGKNNPDAIDHQSFALRKFFEMLIKGDTNAAEILFCSEQSIQERHPLWLEVQQDAPKLLNRKCEGFVGYCRRQAAKYGVKGSRMADVKALIELLQSFEPSGLNTKLNKFTKQLSKFAEEHEHASWINIWQPGWVELWHIECCDRKVATTWTVAMALTVFQKVWDNYGERARAAMSNEGIDWKAISHAMRVATQAEELLISGRITFPRPDALLLMDIKAGRIPYKTVEPMLEAAVERVENCVNLSCLPEETDREEFEALVVKYYGMSVDGGW